GAHLRLRVVVSAEERRREILGAGRAGEIFGERLGFEIDRAGVAEDVATTLDDARDAAGLETAVARAEAPDARVDVARQGIRQARAEHFVEMRSRVFGERREEAEVLDDLGGRGLTAQARHLDGILFAHDASLLLEDREG